jgi:hypothetical protein
MIVVIRMTEVAGVRLLRESGAIRGFDSAGSGLRRFEVDHVSGVSRVRLGEPLGGVFGEKFLPAGALATVGDPGGDVVGIVPGVAVVIECELFDGAIADLHVVEFVGEFPGAITPRTGDARYVVDRRFARVVGIVHGVDLPGESLEFRGSG